MKNRNRMLHIHPYDLSHLKKSGTIIGYEKQKYIYEVGMKWMDLEEPGEI